MQTLQAEYAVPVSRLDKVLYPEAGLTKKDLLDYMIQMHSLILPQIAKRPLTMIRFPDGIQGKSFYQKNIPESAPQWITTYREWSDKGKREIAYVIADSLATLLWMANQACLEWHCWFSTADCPEQPTNLAFDLDPSVEGFDKVVEVAFFLRDVLKGLGLASYPKTSGATGLQIFVPIRTGYTFDETRRITSFVAKYTVERLPDIATIERLVKDRGTKVYIDYLQHAPHKTLIAPYSLRAVPNACVSTPILWEELEKGATPDRFTIRTVPGRVKNIGDLFAPMTRPGYDLDDILKHIPETI